MKTTEYIVASSYQQYLAIVKSYGLHEVPTRWCWTVRVAVVAAIADGRKGTVSDVMIWTHEGPLTPYRFLPDAGQDSRAA